jgi:hypothetical protein
MSGTYNTENIKNVYKILVINVKELLIDVVYLTKLLVINYVLSGE